MNSGTNEQQPASLPEPQAGGSYTRDPVTGELTLVSRTGPPKPRDKRAQPDAPADEAAKAGVDPSAAEAAEGEPNQPAAE